MPCFEGQKSGRGLRGVLVLFNEKHQQSGKVTRRGFYLFANEERLTDGKRPKFVPLDQAETHAVIPIFKLAPPDPTVIPGDIYAISAVPWAYSLASHGRIVAEFELPAYGDWLTAKKFFLFPVAAAADVLGVGAAAGVIGAMEGVKPSFSTTVR